MLAQAVSARDRFWDVISAILKIIGLFGMFGAITLGFLRLAVDVNAWFLAAAIVAIGLGADLILKHSKVLLPRFSDATGTARWGNLADLKKAGLVNAEVRGYDILCGEFNGKPVCYPGERNILTVGMIGTGKDTRFLTPNLKHMKGRSAIVLDPKGEQAAITARYRSKLGPVFVFNPTGLLTETRPHLKSSGFNPLVSLRTDDPLFYDKATEISESLIARDSVAEKHWPEGAEAILSALIMRAKLGETEGKPYQASLGLVNEMLCEPYAEHDDGGLKKILRQINSHSYRPMAKLVGRFLGYSKENGSFISVALNNLKSLNSPAIATDLERHPIMKDGPFKGKPFDFEMMKHQVITVYVILPDDMFDTHAVWLRLIVANALNALKRSMPGKIRPVLMLNEIGNLGYLKPLANGINMVRGKGITIWTLWQSLQQITDIYGKAGAAAFKSGAGVLSSLRVNDPETKRELSERAGNRTVVEKSYNSEADDSSKGKSEKASGYELMRPEGFANLGDGETVCWIDSMPFKLDAPFYDPRGLDPNPYYMATHGH